MRLEKDNSTKKSEFGVETGQDRDFFGLRGTAGPFETPQMDAGSSGTRLIASSKLCA